MQALSETELTWGERRELKGKLEGEIRGKQEILLRQLRRKFGPLPEPFVQQLEAIGDPDALDELSEQVLTAVTWTTSPCRSRSHQGDGLACPPACPSLVSWLYRPDYSLPAFGACK